MVGDINIYQCCITRFTNSTWEENYRWREENNCLSNCIYNSTFTLPISIGDIPNVFIIEMNITEKCIIGVGLIKNKELPIQPRIYSENKHNFHSYKGKYRMDLEDFNEGEREKLKLLEKYLFYGYSHLIRGIGFSKLPDRLIHKPGKGKKNIEFKNIYTDMFKKAFKRKVNSETI
tara:strand:+ start:20 stop:544 length:525 start_codon:yes stop_codon:yes gene_type:complete